MHELEQADSQVLPPDADAATQVALGAHPDDAQACTRHAHDNREGRVRGVQASRGGAGRWQVVGVYVGFVDTDLTARLDRPEVQPATVAVAALEAVEADQPEAIVDEYSRSVKAAPISSVRFTPASRSSSSRLFSSAFQ